MFEPLNMRHGDQFGKFLAERVEVVEGDLSRADLGMDEAIRKRLGTQLDLVVNSSGLTDFNPDLREALEGNVAAPMNLLEFIRSSDHAALLHLSTCYVVGKRDGRVREEAYPNYTPAGVADFNAEHEWKSLDETIRNVEARAQGPEMTAALRRQALGRRSDRKISAMKSIMFCAATANAGSAIVSRASACVALNASAGQILTRSPKAWPNPCSSPAIAGCHRDCLLPPPIVKLPQIFHSRMERRHQHFRATFLFARHGFRQLPTSARKCLDSSRRHGLPRNDSHRRRANSAASSARLSTRNVRVESVQHGPLYRVNWLGSSQTLSRAARPRTLAPPAIRYHSCLEKPLSKNERARAKGRDFAHQSRSRASTI